MKSSPGAAVAASREHKSEIAQLLRHAYQETGIVRGDPGALKVELLRGDGSDRRFYRVGDSHGSSILLVSPRKTTGGIDENDSYQRIGEHLWKRGIPVPRIHVADPVRGFFILEDLGDAHLQGQANRGVIDLKKLYGHVVRLLLELHKRAPEGFASEFCFDAPVYSPEFIYERELEYFRKAFLVGFLGLDVDREDLRLEFENLAEEAAANNARHVIHRDFQSRNVMVTKGKLRIIDFQGMRFGPPAYDLASILLDPYVSLPNALQGELARRYWAEARRFLACRSSQFWASYVSTRLCRNLQVLGAYGFLGCVKGKVQFLKYVPTALKQLVAWLHGPCRGRFPGLCRIVSRICSEGAMQRNNAACP